MSMNLLTAPDGNPKLAKSLKLNVLTSVLHLAPYTLSGFNTCPMASEGCKKACLNTAGRGGIIKKGEKTNAIQEARIRKTKLFYNDREEFFRLLVKDIETVIRKAKRENYDKVGIRLNGTSDIRFELYKFEGLTIFERFPEVQFYDYTKIHNRKHIPNNYHLTYSLCEDNDDRALIALENGFNVAAVFRDELPAYFLGREVINGDDHDYRPMDRKGVIVGLKAKGKAKKDTSGFVRDLDKDAIILVTEKGKE